MPPGFVQGALFWSFFRLTVLHLLQYTAPSMTGKPFGHWICPIVTFWSIVNGDLSGRR
jgi:hypothetical protein